MADGKKNKYIITIILVLLFISNSNYYFQQKSQEPGNNEKLSSLYALFSNTYKNTPEKGLPFAEEALQLAKETGNIFIQIKADLFIGNLAFRERNTAKANKCYSEALQLSRKINNEYLEAQSLLGYGVFLGHALNKPDSALLFVKRCYSIGLSLNDTTLLKPASYNLISLNRFNGDPVKAISSAKTALEYNKRDNPTKEGIYSELFLIYADLGNLKEAAVYFNLAFELCEKNKSFIQMANLANRMGGFEDLDFESSVKYRLKALNIYKTIKDPFGIGYTYNLLGMNYSAAGKSEEAIGYFKKAVEVLSRINDRQHLAFANANLACEYVKINKSGLALSHLKKAIEYGESINDKLVLADAYKAAAYYYRKTGDKGMALASLDKASGYAREIKNPNFLKDIYNEYSLCYDAMGDSKNALYYLRLKNEIADTIQKQNSKKSYIEMMVKYETLRTKEEAAEAQKNASSLREESEKKSVIFWSAAGGTSAIAIILIIIYWKRISVFLNFYKNISRKKFIDKRNNKSVARIIENENYDSMQIDEETSTAIKGNLIKLMEAEKKFTDCNLSLTETAKILNTNTTYLSRIINEQSGMNFSNYINKYRIEEAKKLLDSGKQDSLTFEGIGKCCGFLSRSAFNKAFKKFTGLTPTEYSTEKKENL